MPKSLKKIRKTYNHLGFNTFNLFGIFLVCFFLAYSLQYLYMDGISIFLKYYPQYATIVIKVDDFLTQYWIKKLILENMWIAVTILFLMHLVFFQNNKITFLQNVITSFIDSTIQKMSLLIPIKQFATFMLFTHANPINAPVDIFNGDFSTPILLSSFLISAFIISIIPGFFNALVRWRKNSKFAVNSGLIFHFNTIEDLEASYEFKKLLDSLGEIKTIKLLGVTGLNTFVNLDSYMSVIVKSTHLKSSKKPKIIIMLSEQNSDGLKKRAKNINQNINILNQEIERTLQFITDHKILNNTKYTSIKQYKSEPKYKIIIVEGEINIALIQTYADKQNILDEQVYIYKDKVGGSMYKIIDQQFDDLYSMLR